MLTSADFLQALLLGLVQGLSEFLPISSSGHLVLVEQFLFLENFDLFFILVLHLGTLLAIISYYRKELFNIIKGFCLKPCHLQGPSRVVYLLILATLPSVIGAFFLKNLVEKSLLDPRWTGFGFMLTAILLVFTYFPLKKLKKNTKALFQLDVDWNSFSFLQAFIIGLAQVCAFFPGMSRSGWTIALALFLGCSQKQAVFFSLLLAIPACFGGFIVELFNQNQETLGGSTSLLLLALAFFSSWLVGYLALIGLIRSLKNLSFPLFALYLGPLGIFIIFYLK